MAETVEELADSPPVVDLNPPQLGGTALFYITDVSGSDLEAILGSSAPVGGEATFTIKLPPDLTDTSWEGGVTVTITDVNNASATDGVDNETWKMTRQYYVGAVILAAFDEDGELYDVNRAGRMWAFVPP